MLGVNDSEGREKLRDLVIVEIGTHRELRRRPEAVEHESDAVLLDEPPGRFDRLWRAVSVVDVYEVELAPIDATLLVYNPEIGGLGAPDDAIG